MPTPIAYQVRDKTAYLFRFFHPDTGKRIRLRLGVISANNATEAGIHLDQMIEALTYHGDYPPRTIQWLSTLPDDVYQRFVNAGLVGDRTSARFPILRHFLADYLRLKEGGSSRSGQWKPRTVKNRKQSIDDLQLYFGEETPIDQIDAGAADEWLHWMMAPTPEGRGLAPATASKKLKDARQFFRFAQRKQYISTNPFDGIRLPPQDNPDRLVYLPTTTIERVLEEIKDPEFRLLIALGRYAGFRIPSEAGGLRWSDINWDKKTIRVTAPKKSGDSRGGQRICRLFDELVPFLKAVKSLADTQDGFVLPSMCSAGRENHRTQWGRYIDRAGVDRWPRPFQNLRASALTDLAEKYPLQLVCKWLGNSIPVAMNHYVMLKGIDLSDIAVPSVRQDAAE
jgi:integrase